MRRRTAVARLFGTASATLLAACSSPAPSQLTSTPAPATAKPAAALTSAPVAAQPTATTQAQPRSGGTLHAAIQADLPNVDPHYNAPSAYDALNARSRDAISATPVADIDAERTPRRPSGALSTLLDRP